MIRILRTQVPLALLLLSLGAFGAGACSESSSSPDDGASGGATGGRNPGVGGLGAIDPDALAKNCEGLVVEASASCSKLDLICQEASGRFCVCGEASRSLRQLEWDCRNVGTPGSGGSSPQGGQGGQGGAPPSEGGTSFGGEPSSLAGSEN